MSFIQQSSDIHINLKYRKRKSYFETRSRTTVDASNAHLREATEKLDAFFKQYNLELDTVILREIDRNAEPFKLTVVKRVENSEAKKIKTIHAVKIKDVTHTSENNYKMMHSYCKEFMPPLSSVRTSTKNLNHIFTIHENQYGYFNDIEQKLEFIMKFYLKQNADFFPENVVKIKICADGFQATKKGRQILNVSFSIIHSLTNPYSPDGHILIGEYCS